MSLKKLPLALGIALTASAVLIVIMVSRLAQPMFTVTNLSENPVFVSATWLAKSQDFGTLEPNAELQFNLADEAALVIRATTADGLELTSEEIYFTQGAGILAEISATEIEVKYRHQK